jgi:hypothetical protein
MAHRAGSHLVRAFAVRALPMATVPMAPITMPACPRSEARGMWFVATNDECV